MKRKFCTLWSFTILCILYVSWDDFFLLTEAQVSQEVGHPCFTVTLMEHCPGSTGIPWEISTSMKTPRTLSHGHPAAPRWRMRTWGSSWGGNRTREVERSVGLSRLCSWALLVRSRPPSHWGTGGYRGQQFPADWFSSPLPIVFTQTGPWAPGDT